MSEITKITIDGKEYIKEKFDGVFTDLIFENIDSYLIQRYAEWNLGMIEDDDCECKNDIRDHSDDDFIKEASNRGMIMFKTRSISDAMKVEEIKKELNY